MADLSRLTIPVKDLSTGAVTPQTFNLKGSGGSADAYSINDSASTTINDGDYIPMLDGDGTTKKKSLWSTIIAAIKAALATVATSGSYNDLINKPTLGTAAAKASTNAVTQNSTDLVESGAVYSAIAQYLASGAWTIANNRLYIKDIS